MSIDEKREPNRILCIDDNEADIGLFKFLFSTCNPKPDLTFLRDGETASNFLFQRGEFYNAPRPGLIIADLNMPKKGGKELIRELKASVDLCQIPVIILSTSSNDREVSECYCSGAAAFISKPTNLETFLDTMQTVVKFYFDCIILPTFERSDCEYPPELQ